MSDYDHNLGKNPANHQPLTPLTLLERAAAVWPERTAVIHGRETQSYHELYARCRRLGSALAKRGIGVGDTVSAMLPNVPSMLEAHYGVAMTGAVLHSINTRLDPAIITFMLDHAETKVLITDREFAPTIKAALAGAKVKPLVIDYDDLEFPQTGEQARHPRLRGVPGRGRSQFRLAHAGRRVGGDRAQLHVGHDRQSEGRRRAPSRRRAHVLREYPRRGHGHATRSTCGPADVPLQRLGIPLDAVGRRRHARLPARGPRQADLRSDRRAQGHAHVRRADRDVDAAQRARDRQARPAAPRRVRHRRCAAAGGRAGAHGRRRLQRHPRLRTDRGLRPLRRQRVEGGVGRSRQRRAGENEVAPGRALHRARRPHRDGPDHDAESSRPTGRRWAR